VTDRLLTAREVAELLNVSTETVLRWARRGDLPAVRMPGTTRGRLRFRPDDVDAWIDAHATGAADREVSATRNDRAHTAAYESPVPFPVSATRPRDRAATTEKGHTDATR
jgi:excisionase family DNA binding protein